MPCHCQGSWLETKAAYPASSPARKNLQQGEKRGWRDPQCFVFPFFPPFTAPLTQEDPKSSRDVSEELSRQLEDILNTYCVDASQGEDGGQGEPPEAEEAEKGRSESPRNGEQEPGGPEMNGEKENAKGGEEFRPGEEGGDRDHKKAQEKKKAKGLGEGFPASPGSK